MQLFLSTPLVCHYVSFHIAAEHSHLTVRNFLSCAKRVLRWWQTQAEGKHPSLVEGLQWLQTLNEQAKESEKADTQKAAGLWPLTMSHHARFLDPGLHTGSSVTPSARRPALRSLAGESKAGCAVVTWPVVFSRLWLT
ncbi:TPA: hypothetical protein ACH3X3_003381 [Trebouxia sp. C0006]